MFGEHYFLCLIHMYLILKRKYFEIFALKFNQLSCIAKLFIFSAEQDLHELGPGLNPRSTYLKRKGKIYTLSLGLGHPITFKNATKNISLIEILLNFRARTRSFTYDALTV